MTYHNSIYLLHTHIQEGNNCKFASYCYSDYIKKSKKIYAFHYLKKCFSYSQINSIQNEKKVWPKKQMHQNSYKISGSIPDEIQWSVNNCRN